MAERARRQADAHYRAAATIFEVPIEQVTPQMRRVAKEVNFALSIAGDLRFTLAFSRAGGAGLMGMSAGAGSPLRFRCSQCRKHDDWRNRSDRGWLVRVRLTGQEKPHRGGRSVALGVRSDIVKRQYECLDCGHIGWSNHSDLCDAIVLTT